MPRVFRNLASHFAEDGAEQVRRHGVREKDVVVGIAASGTTPFVHGALAEARARGAGRVLLVCNLTGVPPDAADVIIAPLVGPEVITGATRLRAATACKMVLNMMTIGTMLQTGLEPLLREFSVSVGNNHILALVDLTSPGHVPILANPRGSNPIAKAFLF